ncbi:hypothetical protein ACQY0O_003833 [Thecaphora frezii]
MASINSLRTFFSQSLKGKARGIDLPLPTASSSRAFSVARATAGPSAGPSSQPFAASTSSSPAPSLSSGPMPTEPISSTSEALQLLRAQPNHYVVASITGRTFMLAPSDLVTVPRLKDVQVGDVIELDRIHEVGSRDFTLRAQDPMHCRTRGPVAAMHRSVSLGQNSQLATVASTTTTASPSPPSSIAQEVRQMANSWATRLHPAGLAHVGATLSPQTVRVRAVVMEHTKGAMERIVKKKRRKGYKKTIEHKQPYTRIRIERIEIAPRDA